MILKNSPSHPKKRTTKHSHKFSIQCIDEYSPPPYFKIQRTRNLISTDSFKAGESFNLHQSIQRSNEFLIEELKQDNNDGWQLKQKRGYQIILTVLARQGKQASQARYRIIHYPQTPYITLYMGQKNESQRMKLLKSIQYEMRDRLLFNIAPNAYRKTGNFIKLTENAIFRMGNKLYMKVIGVYAFTGPAKDNLSDFYFCRKINGIGGKQIKYEYKVQCDQENDVCRICLQVGNTQFGSLMSGCHCKGTGGFVHDSCLRQWMKQKFRCKVKQSRDNQLEVTICTFINFVCEICGFDLPKVFEQNNMIHNIIDIPIPKPPYIILYSHYYGESYEIYILSRPKNVNLPIHLKEDEGYSVTFGRSSDVAIPLYSIQSQHLQIKFMESHNWTANFYLQDLGSRYGTFTTLPEQGSDLEYGDTYEFNNYHLKLD